MGPVAPLFSMTTLSYEYTFREAHRAGLDDIFFHVNLNRLLNKRWSLGGNFIMKRHGAQCRVLPLPIKMYLNALTHFGEKGFFFQWAARIREIKKKR